MRKKKQRKFRWLAVFFSVMLALCLGVSSLAAEAGEPGTEASIRLNRSTVSLSLSGTKTVQLRATVRGKSKKVSWSSGNRKVASVSSTGRVTAKSAGKAVITARANGKTAKCTVTVKKAQALSGKRAQHKKYVSYIKSFERRYKNAMVQGGMSRSRARVYFSFVDIDGDGTDECVVRGLYDPSSSKVMTSDSMNSYTGKTEIYAIKSGKVKTVVKQELSPYAHMENILVYKSRRTIEYWFSHSHTFYTYRNGTLSKKACGSCSSPYAGGEPWYVNNKAVSRSSYEKYLNRMQNGGRGYVMYQYTTKNINRFL